MIYTVESVNLKMVKAAHSSNKPRRVINILSQAVILMAPRPNCLTPAHSHLLQVRRKEGKNNQSRHRLYITYFCMYTVCV